MIVILYHSRHGSTAKIARVINSYLEGKAYLMDLEAIEYEKLDCASTIVLGMPIYNGILDEDMVNFIKHNQPLLIPRHYAMYIVGLQASEFMSFVSAEFDYQLLKDVKVIAGLGGALYFPKLSLTERLSLSVFNKRYPIIPKAHDDTIYENFNNEEIEIFAKKIARLEEASR